jgi:hypothetical protein
MVSDLPIGSATALDRLPIPEPPCGRPTTVGEVLPPIEGGNYCVLLTELDLKTGPEEFVKVGTFDQLFSLCGMPRSQKNLERIRAEWRLTESTKCLGQAIVDTLIAATPGARWAYIRCWDDPDEYLWRVDCAEFLSAFDLLKILPHPYGEYEVTDENATWYLRLRDDDPFIFISGPTEVVDRLEREARPLALRVDAGFLFAA